MPWEAIPWTSSGLAGAPPQTPYLGLPMKHSRALWDPKKGKIVVAAGDRNGSDLGCVDIWEFTPHTGVASSFREVATQLITSSGAGMRPVYPDNCTWVMDTKRNEYLIARGFWAGIAYSTSFQPLRSTDEWLLKSGRFFPTSSGGHAINTYSSIELQEPPSPYFWGGDSNCNFGVYDPITDSMWRFFWDGNWGNSLQQVPCYDSSSTGTPPTAVLYNVGTGNAVGSFLRGYLRNTDPHSRQPALDVQGRDLYCLGQSASALLTSSDDGWGLIRVNLNTPTVGERIALPPEFRPQIVAPGDGRDYIMCFDSIRRQIQIPQITGFNGEVWSGLIYDVATSVWSEVQVPTTAPFVVGTVFAYSPTLAAGVLSGGRAGTSIRPATQGQPYAVPEHYFLLRPDSSSGTPPPVVLSSARVTAVHQPSNVASSILEGNWQFSIGTTSSGTTTVTTTSNLVDYAQFSGLVLGQPYTVTGARLDSTGGLLQTPFSTTHTFTGATTTSSAAAVDATPPVVTIVNPTSSMILSGTVSIQYTATDTSGIQRTEVRINSAILPTTIWNTNTVPDGNNILLEVQAWDNSNAQNTATATKILTVQNATTSDVAPPPVPPPTPQAIFLNPVGTGRVAYVLWAPVPTEAQALVAARQGADFVSAWPHASVAEIAALQSGLVREKSGTMVRVGTDEQMKAALIALWTRFNADTQALDDWTLFDNYFDGTAWTVRTI